MCYRAGTALVVPFGVAVPERCVRCNAPTELGKENSYSWHHPAWYLTILLSPLVYIIVGLIAGKRASVAVGLCELHRTRRRNVHLLGWGALAAAIVSIVLAANDVGGGLFALIACAAILVALIAYFRGRLLHAARISDSAIHLGGCGNAFLDGLDRRK
ncbi:hypothetical protein LP419_07640 [Massilia sp. H-1]|nr:hypothetical protein LP419_07640 [Massilia sp. H-1]